MAARSRISHLIRDAAASGTSVVCASLDPEQLATICDRVVVFSRGRVVRELAGAGLTREGIAEACQSAG